MQAGVFVLLPHLATHQPLSSSAGDGDGEMERWRDGDEEMRSFAKKNKK